MIKMVLQYVFACLSQDDKSISFKKRSNGTEMWSNTHCAYQSTVNVTVLLDLNRIH